MNTMTSFMGWCAVINVGVLAIFSLLIILLQSSLSPLHASLFGIDKQDVLRGYFHYLVQYKVAVIVLNIVPYFALKVIG